MGWERPWGILEDINTDPGLLKNVHINLSGWEEKASQEGCSLNKGRGEETGVRKSRQIHRFPAGKR